MQLQEVYKESLKKIHNVTDQKTISNMLHVKSSKNILLPTLKVDENHDNARHQY